MITKDIYMAIDKYSSQAFDKCYRYGYAKGKRDGFKEAIDVLNNKFDSYCLEFIKTFSNIKNEEHEECMK